MTHQERQDAERLVNTLSYSRKQYQDFIASYERRLLRLRGELASTERNLAFYQERLTEQEKASHG